MEHVDFHVGLLKGYLLAHNAQQQVLHALDVLLTGYRSQAGGVVGLKTAERVKLQTTQQLDELRAAADDPVFRPDPPREEVDEDTEDDQSKHFWTRANELKLNKLKNGKRSIGKIAKEFGKTKSSIYQRIAVMKSLGRWHD